MAGFVDYFRKTFGWWSDSTVVNQFPGVIGIDDETGTIPACHSASVRPTMTYSGTVPESATIGNQPHHD